MADMLTKHCPHCGYTITYSTSEKTVCCPCCDKYVKIDELRASLDTVASSDSSATAAQVSGAFVASVIESSENGLAYIENFFDNYSWDEYIQTTQIKIDSIQEMVEKQKVKNAANPSTWYLEFKSISVPVLKKIEGLAKLEQGLVEKYNSVDNTEIYSKFDALNRNANKLKEEKEHIIKILENDIKFAKKFQGDNKTIGQMEFELLSLVQKFELIKTYKEIDDVPAIQAIKSSSEMQIINDLSLKGVDAEGTYQRAINAYKSIEDKSVALRDFSLVKGYKDSEEYIKRINKLFTYNGDLFILGDRSYVTGEDKQEEVPVAKAGCLKKGKQAAPTQSLDLNKGKTFALYGIQNQMPLKDPSIKGITGVLAVYASCVYYVKDNKSIHVYNMASREDREIDKGDSKCYCDTAGNVTFWTSRDGSKIYLKKILPVSFAKQGCLSSKKNPVNNKNNYSLIVIQLGNNIVEQVIPQLVDIEFVSKDDHVFYTEVVNKDADYEDFKVYNINTRENKKVLEYGCHIYAVKDENVIYGELNTNTLNEDLYVYNLKNDQNILLEKNVRDYKYINEGKIYYTIGNDENKSLFSINIDGTERTEIMRNAEEIYAIDNGWMYVKKFGRRWVYDADSDRIIRDSTFFLIKISLDGRKRINITDDFYRFVKLENGHIYYLDEQNDLHIVRSDGKMDSLIAENVNNIIIEKNYIFFTRQEIVNDKVDDEGISFYRTDLDGSNLVKIAFNIRSIKNYDNESIYYIKDEEVTLKYRSTDKKSGEDSKNIVRHKVTRYYKYNKETGESVIEITLGMPDNKALKSGCLKKDLGDSYQVIPTRYKYERFDKVKAGKLFNEQVEDNPVPAKKNTGCAPLLNNNKNKKGSSNNAGCSPRK